MRLLIRLSWMHLRLTTAGLPDLISDCTHITHPHAQAIRRALMKPTPALISPCTALPGVLTSQVTGRLMGHLVSEIAAWATALQPPRRPTG
ncbi:hypothetical protein ABZ914_34190 [Spirillospora sp. NPDC046719]